MRLFGKKFIPGVRVEVENPAEEELNKKNNKDILDIVSNHSEPSSVTTYEPNSEETTNCDEDEEENYESALESFEAFTREFTFYRFLQFRLRHFDGYFQVSDGVREPLKKCYTAPIGNPSTIP